ncbi:nuclear transport factor 2 family protein [Erythrobacter sp. HKB08]|uniref:nuclear transport factor 2 family protein n=1 Tax=Erythrobacter sp. HKB08 TaxID=2502843 RepID=UPI0010090846|nr:nuclear transport factor 2 family protein [Erythrobacter sp. HKB08]
MRGANPKAVASRFLAAIEAEDLDTIESLLANDVVYTDSRGDSISGYSSCVEAMRRMFEMDIAFAIQPSSMTQAGENVLIRGRCSSRDPRLNAQCLWRFRVRNGKLAEYQSHRASDPPAFARFLMPEAVC